MNRHNRLLVVVHVEELEQALRNAKMAFENGADGIFLINHSMPAEMLMDVYYEVGTRHPNEWIGINYLGVGRSRAVALLPSTADALWMDNPGYVEGGDTSEVLRHLEDVHNVSDGALLFGGFDFKYQTPVKDLQGATREIAPVVDVITTSGSATGSPPSLDKMRIMRASAPEALIAIASGMSLDNIGAYLDLVDYFLVATGISTSHTELNPEKVRKMARTVHRTHH